MRTSDTDSLNVERLARAEMRVNGQKVEQSRVRCGDIVEIDQRFMMMCTKRPVSWPQRKFESAPRFAFGAADPDGIVGESPSAWALRAHIASVARGDTHVLVHGPSGSGKELAAQAVHRRSRRRASELVARNAATFPEGLIDAELFGNMKNFPNPGMREREGLFGAANNSTLFLDEIGELPQALQAHLLRALDRGEYQRLGESRARKANVRLLGATNRELNSLRSDFLARFTQRIELVGLNDRRDDIPLLAQHISRALAAEDPSIAQRFFDGERARMSARLIYSLVSHDYSTNARELKELLWRASADSVGAALDWTGVITPKVDSSVDPATLTREQVIAALERCGGVRERAWRVLGLRSRHQLKRLLQKFNI